MKIIEESVHKRKWNVVIDGLEEIAGEHEDVTRGKVEKLAKDVFQTNHTVFKACQRLNHTVENSAIHVSLVDLSVKNKWFANAKNLKQYNTSTKRNVSISQDVPPVIRPFKRELLKKRADLPAGEKGKTKLRYLSTYPFVILMGPSFTINLPPKSVRKLSGASCAEL